MTAVGGQTLAAPGQATGATSHLCRGLSAVRLRADSSEHLLSRLNKVVSPEKLICEFALLPGHLGARKEKDQRHSYPSTSNVSVLLNSKSLTRKYPPV